MKLDEIPTPALIVDLATMTRNIEHMAAYFADRACKLRPHFKAHKTPAIARRQLAAGSCTGITCATIGEAEVLVAEGVTTDLLIANQVVGPGKAGRCAALAATSDLIVAVDSDAGLEELSRAAQAAGTEVGVLVDVNVGMPRCGVAPREPAVALGRRVAETKGVRLRGLMGYEGHVVGIVERAERTERAHKSMDRLLTTVEMFRDAGLSTEIVSGGGSGTFDITGAMDGMTEIQAGSYVLMDAAYKKLDLPSTQALSILATVISRPRPDRCVADAGLKAASVDHGNPEVKDQPGASVLYLSDEHASITLPEDSPLAVGDRIELWPSHVDPTINLHDVIYALEGDTVVEVWPVAARGYIEQRQQAQAGAGVRA